MIMEHHSKNTNDMEKLQGIDEIIYINLDRATERKNKMEKMLIKSGVKVTRFQGFDGKTQDIESEISVQSFRGTLGYLNPGEKSLILSYHQVFRYIQSQPGNLFLVLEDDAEF